MISSKHLLAVTNDHRVLHPNSSYISIVMEIDVPRPDDGSRSRRRQAAAVPDGTAEIMAAPVVRDVITG